MYRLSLAAITVAFQLLTSCHSRAQKSNEVHALVPQLQYGTNYNLEKISPSGTYRVRVEVRAAPKKGTREYTERVRYEFYRRNELIHTHNWEESDQYEPSFDDMKPNFEWVADNILSIRTPETTQPFFDEIVLENRTDEVLKYISIGYGRGELFWLFDTKPTAKNLLHASPQFKPDGTSNYFIGYGGVTQSGKQFEGAIEAKQRNSAKDGPLKFAITLEPKDLR